MKKFVIAGTLAGALALGGNAFAQSSTPAAKQPAAGAMSQTATKPATAEQPADKPAATKKKSTAKAAGDNAAGSHTAPKAQPNTTGDATAPGPMALGTVHIPKGVKADGKDLPAGVYSVRLTGDEAKPDAKGSDQKLERWVEFVKGGQVAGREVVSIVPATEKQLVQKDTPPPAGGSKVEGLKGGDYVRVWINKGGNYYLVHLTKS
ncbi:MAG TPA: hypothetical protein VGI12_17300 [Vicinamibacterales bacterium]